VALAEAVAGAGGGEGSVELIDQLIAIFDKSGRENGIDLTNAAILAAGAEGDAARREIGPVLAWHWTRQSLILARLAAGGAIDEVTAKALSLDWAVGFLASYPHSGLAKRIGDLSETERQSVERMNPKLLGRLQLVALVLEGRTVDAQALVESDPAASEFDGSRIVPLIEAQENAGLRTRAIAALDAYLGVFPAKDLAALRLLLMQRQTEKAKTMLRAFVSGGAGAFGVSDIFVGVMLLRELGDDMDVPTLVGLRKGVDSLEASRRLTEIVDALAWEGNSAEIEGAIRQLPRELAHLPAKETACLRDTLQGLLAVSLARGGALEEGIRLVADRKLEQRQFCWVGRGYDSKPIFDLRFLVQEWVRRGHAAP
jgi:hypothetical protein